MKDFQLSKVIDFQHALNSQRYHDHPSFSLTKPLLYSYISIFLLLFTLGILTFALPLKVDELHLNTELTGPLLSVFGIVAILIFILPTNSLFDSLRKTQLMTMGFMTISIFNRLYSLTFCCSFVPFDCKA